MIITIVNEAADKVSNASVLSVLRAISRQIFHDFTPYWHLSAQLRLATVKSTSRQNLDPHRDAALQQLDPVSGGGVIRLRTLVNEEIWFQANELNADVHQTRGWSQAENAFGTWTRGFHFLVPGCNFPIGHVIVTDDKDQIRNDWTTTLSHEILEMIANPHVNLRVHAPHPDPQERSRNKRVYVHREVCDPVQDDKDGYEVDGVRMANFVLPLYFLEAGHETERVDFLGSRGLESFGVKAQGYIPYFDPETGKEEQYPTAKYVRADSRPLAAHHHRNHSRRRLVRSR